MLLQYKEAISLKMLNKIKRDISILKLKRKKQTKSV